MREGAVARGLNTLYQIQNMKVSGNKHRWRKPGWDDGCVRASWMG